MKHFCTITTFDYLYKVNALCKSLQLLESDFVLHVLVVDKAAPSAVEPQITFYNIQDIKQPIALALRKKYASNNNKLRWSFKPVFLLHLLQQADKVLYVDNDVAFFHHTDFLFDELNHHSVLLTPHHYPRSPHQSQNWLEANFTIGLFNAGFVAVNKNAHSLLNWWAGCCHYRCEKNRWRGLYDDQKYLDLFPVIEPQTKILEHQGCNVAGWNIEVSKRTKVNESVLINHQYPIVFIHFNEYTIRMLEEGNDPLLQPFWKLYLEMLQSFKPEVKAEYFYRPQSVAEKFRLAIWKLFS